MWRRFTPVKHRRPQFSPVALQTDPTIQRAEVLARSLMRQHHTFDGAINVLRQEDVSRDAVKLLASLLLQVPRAARAQAEMDRHKRSFHDRRERLLELIDFNDTLVAGVLAIPAEERVDFADELRAAINRFSAAHRTPNFNKAQYDAILHGLSREIAVYLAAQKHGYQVLMTSRTDDAFGIDMQIRDPQKEAYVNIDCKTRSSYYFRIKELMRQHRLTPEEAQIADQTSYCPVVNHHNNIEIRVILVRIDHILTGDIVDFEFVSTDYIISLLEAIIDKFPIYGNGFGKTIAPLDFK